MNQSKEGRYWDKSWNPVIVEGGGWHCTKCSPGCFNCWAEKYNLRGEKMKRLEMLNAAMQPRQKSSNWRQK